MLELLLRHRAWGVRWSALHAVGKLALIGSKGGDPKALARHAGKIVPLLHDADQVLRPLLPLGGSPPQAHTH